MTLKERLSNFFGKDKESIGNTVWDWSAFKTTENFPVSKNLLDWVIGQEHALAETKLCIDEWIAKLLWLKKKEWWKVFEDPSKHKPQSREMLPAGPFLLLMGDPGTGKSLLGRAMSNYMTDLYLANQITLCDVLSWKNPVLPSQPRISIHLRGKGKEIIQGISRTVRKKSFWKSSGSKFLQGFMIVFGLGLIVGSLWSILGPWFSNPTVYDWATLGYSPLQTAYHGNLMSYFMEMLKGGYAALVIGGASLIFFAFFISYLGKMMGTSNMQGIGGASNSSSPKLLIDNSGGEVPFIDATGHGSAQLFGSIAWDPYQTGGLGTPEHQRMTAGDVHRAHLGILFIDEIKNLTGQEAITLLTVLEDGQLPVALRSQFHGGDSITGDAMIFFKEDGNIRYGQFSELIKSFENNKTIEVLSLEHMDFKCKKLVWTPVLKVFRRGKKPIKAVTLIDGKSIRLTKDHSLFRYNNLHSQKPLIPTTIEYGKCITINKIEVPKIDMESQSENDLEFYGYWIGDGHFEAGKIVGLATGRSEEDRDFVYSYAKKLGITATLKNDKGDMRIYSTRLVRKMKTLGFVSGAFAKRIPEWIFFLPENKVKAFIKGYRRSDGSRYQKDRRMITQFGSVNRKLLEDFQTLFSILGIEASISSGKLNGKKAFKSLNPQYQLTIWKDSSEDFEVNHLRNQGLLSLHRIRKIVDEEEAEVFDISTGNECFIANGILCHNTAAMAVASEPIPAMFFLIAAGNLDSMKQIHPALLDRIQGYGKVVYMSNDMPDNVENRRKYVQFISQETKRFNLLPASKEACISIIGEARRKSGRNDRLTCKFRPMISVIKTASVLASNEDEKVVSSRHVEEALSKHCKSLGFQVMEKQISNMAAFKVINPHSKPKIGQIHGLAIHTLNEDTQDKVGAVLTVRASAQKKHGQAYFVVTGTKKAEDSFIQDSISKVRHVILQRLGKNVSMDYCTHVDFAQEHEVDGPSAGITMTLCLLSALTKQKIRQDVAITGEINIGCDGQTLVTPIGGVHEKIMAAQAWGFKKVVIPLKNFEHSIDSSDYKIEVVGAATLDDYIREVMIPKRRKNGKGKDGI